MENNAFISISFKDLLNILDARASISIYTGEKKEDIVKFNSNVYELLADKEFIDSYGSYSVAGFIGLLGNSANILITKERIA